jgi:hypothetical protein
VRRADDLHRQFEQRPQSGGDLLPDDAAAQPLVQRESGSDDEGVVRPVPADTWIVAQPSQVGAAVAGLLGGDAVLVDEVPRRVGRWSEHGGAEVREELARVALVPGRREHDHRRARRPLRVRRLPVPESRAQLLRGAMVRRLTSPSAGWLGHRE